MILVQEVQISACAVIYKQRLEVLAWHIPLQILVVFKIVLGMLGDVGVDVLRGLLPADTKALNQMVGGQTAFPPGDGLD